MAKNTVTLTITIDKKQADNALNNIKAQMESLQKSIKATKEKLNDKSLWGENDSVDKLSKQIKALKNEYRTLRKAYESGVFQMKGIDAQLQEISNVNYNNLTSLRTTLQNSLKNMKFESESYKEAAERLQAVRDEIAKRDVDVRGGMTKDKAQKVMSNIQDYSVSEIEKAIETTKKLRDMQPDAAKWKEYNEQIVQAKKHLDDFNSSIKKVAMEKQLIQLPSISDQAISEQKRYWQEVINGAELSDPHLAKYKKHLADITQEEENRASKKAGAVMGNLQNYSISEIEEAIKLTEKLQKAQKPGSQEWSIYGEEIKKAKEYLQSYIDLDKQINMEDKWSHLSSLSADALAEQKKYWQEMVNGAENGSNELERYTTLLEKVKKEESDRLLNRYEKVLQNPTDYSVSEIQDATKAFEKIRNEQNAGSLEWKHYNSIIETTKETLKNFENEAKGFAMNKRFKTIDTASTNSLAEQKKYWQEMVDSAQKGSAALDEYKEKLSQVIAEERKRIQESGKELVDQYESGNWNKTIGETEEAIKQLKEYRNTLNQDIDTDSLEKIDSVLSALIKKTKEAELVFMSLSQAQAIADSVTNGVFKGTSDDIKKAKEALERFRSSMNVLDDESKIKIIDTQINNLSRSIELGGVNLTKLQDILKDIKHASMDDLQTAAKQLQFQLQNTKKSAEGYDDIVTDLRRVNKELERTKKEWEGQDSLFLRMTKRLSVYMAAYGSLSAVTNYIKDIARENLSLSDSISDVAKTTGLSNDKLAQLGSEIRAIDTRTAQEQLYELAAAAGQLGLKSENEIAGFVRAANMITVSLNELGTEATTQLMKIATLTGESTTGTEKALLSIGSAINELTANSAASAGPIVDLMNRMGGIAAQSGITSAQMAAIGATADALGQSVEITGTSMNKFITTLISSSDQIAYALNMDAKALRGFINNNQTIDAIIAVFEKMNSMGGLEKIAPIMGELGSEGARMAQVLTALSERVDLLKGNLELSNEAYEQAISIQNEYNVKNENAIAILQRMGNAIKEVFVNNILVDGITHTLRAIYNFFSFLKEGTIYAQATIAAITALTATLLANRVAWIKAAQANLAAFLSFDRHTKLQYIQLLWSNLTVSIKNNIVALKAWTVSLFTTRKALDVIKIALSGFVNLLKTNALTLFVGALAGVAAWIIKVKTYVSEAAKATAKYYRELQEETDKVNELFRALERLGVTEGKRAQIINQINQQYRQYLGFMLDEKDSAEKLAAAHKIINAELRKRMALNLQSALHGRASNTYSENLEKTITGISNAIGNVKVVVTDKNKKEVERELYSSDVLHIVSKIISNSVSEAVSTTSENINGKMVFRQNLNNIDIDAIKEKIRSTLIKQFENVKMISNGHILQNNTGQYMYARIESYIEDMISDREEYQKKIIMAENQANIELESISNDVLGKRKSFISQVSREIEDAQKDTNRLEEQLNKANQDLQQAKTLARKYGEKDTSKEAESARKHLSEAKDKQIEAQKALKEHYTKMIDNASDAIENYGEILNSYYANVDRMEDGDLKKKLQTEKDVIEKQVDEYKKLIIEAQKKVPGIDPWGKNRDVKDWKEFADIIENIDTSSATALAAAYKKIKDETANIPYDVESFYDMFTGTSLEGKLKLTDAESIAKQVHDWAEQIKNKLKTKYGRNTELGFIFDADDSKSKIRKEYQAAISAFNAYWKEYETHIKRRAQDEDWTPQTLIRKELEMEQTREKERVELYKALLGETNEFKKDLYIGMITGVDYFANKELDALAASLKHFGIDMEDGLRHSLAKALLKYEDVTLKSKKNLEKLLLEDDYTGKVLRQYMNTLDELGLLFGINDGLLEESTEENGRRRLAYMREWAKEAYNIDAKGLKERMAENELFNAWMEDRSEEDYETLLSQLRKFNDDMAEAEKRAAQRRKRIFDSSDKGMALKAAIESKSSDKEVEKTEAEMWDRFSGMGLATDNEVLRQQIDVSNAQIALYQSKIDASKAYIEQMNKEMEAQRNKLSLEIESLQKEIEYKRKFGIDTMQLEADLLAKKQDYDSLKRQSSIATKEANQEIEESQQKISDTEEEIARKLHEIEQKRLSEAKKYTDAIIEFSSAMTEADWDDVESRQEAAKALVKSLLTTLKDWASIKLTELTMKQMFANQSNAISGQEAIGGLTAKGAEVEGSIAANSTEATANAVGKYGLKGLLIGAAISAALTALMNVALKAVFKSKSEIAAATGASNGKLATGMLTYAEGNYPVLGNDGQVYNAKYEGSNIQTGIYRGGAHFGIFSEKKPEAIIDGDTTQRLIMNHPDIWKAIVTLSKTGRLSEGYGMRTFNSGNINELAKDIANVENNVSSENNIQMAQMQAIIENNNRVIAQLTNILSAGIQANINMYGDNGMYKSMRKAERFASKRGV